MTAEEGQVPLALGAASREFRVGDIRHPVVTILASAFPRAALVFVSLAGLATLVFLFVYSITASANRHVLELGQEQIVQVGRASVSATFNELVADISYLAEEEALQRWLSSGDPGARDMLAREYLAFIVHKRQFSKLRFIDLYGREQVRADRLNGPPRIVPDSELQDKSVRPFFTDTKGLAAGEIYVSPFDLNVEDGAVEQPLRPTIRTAAPVFDAAGQKRGIVVLNYLGQRVLDHLRALGTANNGGVWLVNANGYWLAGPRPQVEWGFALPGREDMTFARSFPAAWERIKGSPGFGQFVEGDRLFSYAPLFAPATSEDGVSIASAPVLYLIANVAESARSEGLAANLGIAWLASLILLAAASLLIGHHGARRQKAEAEIRQLNKRLAGDNEALQALNQELETFSYSVSHDLRTPLRAIDGFSKALLDDCSGKLDELGQKHLARVRAAAQRMGELIDDLLKLSRVGRAELSIADNVNLTEIAASIVENLRRVDPMRDVEFLAAPDIRASCDPRLVRIVLENLLSNAWKFTAGRKPAIVEFGHTQKSGKTVYFVRDNGVGFDMAHAGKLFDAFQRLHANEEFPGTGIGLATVARIMKKHGGRVWAEAAPNRGATLFFTL